MQQSIQELGPCIQEAQARRNENDEVAFTCVQRVLVYLEVCHAQGQAIPGSHPAGGSTCGPCPWPLQRTLLCC